MADSTQHDAPPPAAEETGEGTDAPAPAVPRPVAAVVNAAATISPAAAEATQKAAQATVQAAHQAAQAVAPATQKAAQATVQAAHQAAQAVAPAAQATVQAAQQAAQAVAPVVAPAAQATVQAAQQAAQAVAPAVAPATQAAHQVQAKIEQIGQVATVSPRKAVYRGRRFIVAYAILIMFAAFLSALAKRYRTLPGDVAIARAIQRGQEGKLFVVLMHAVSEVGWQWPSVITRVTASALMWAAGFRMEGAFTAATWSGDLVTIGVKETVGRPRPTKDLVRVTHTLTENSFPSGHVVHYVTFYGFLFYIFFTHLKPGRWRTIVLDVLAILVLLIGPSRIYMGEHWPSDVGGAYLVGSLWLGVEIMAYLEMKSRFQLHRSWPYLSKRSHPIE